MAAKQSSHLTKTGAGALPAQALAVLAVVAQVWDRVEPHLTKSFSIAQALWAAVPAHLSGVMVGLALCFFGGSHFLALAAIEAFRLTGWDATRNHVGTLLVNAQRLVSAHTSDNQKDDDGDGVPDVHRLTGSELLARKLLLVLRTVDTESVTGAVTGLLQGLMAVVGVLKSNLARTLTLATSIGNLVHKPASLHLTPALQRFIAPQYHKWVPLVIDYGCKTLACAVCWYVQQVVSVVQMSLQGGLMAARALVAFANQRKLVNIDTEKSMLDEYIGWTLAALGIYFQIFVGGSLFFPLNILLLPLTLVDYVLAWLVYVT